MSIRRVLIFENKIEICRVTFQNFIKHSVDHHLTTNVYKYQQKDWICRSDAVECTTSFNEKTREHFVPLYINSIKFLFLAGKKKKKKKTPLWTISLSNWNGNSFGRWHAFHRKRREKEEGAGLGHLWSKDEQERLHASLGHCLLQYNSRLHRVGRIRDAAR